MDANAFWELVDLGLHDPEGVKRRVEALSEQELVDFYWLHQDHLDQLLPGDFDYPGHHQDVALCVIRNGRRYFEEIVVDPEHRLPLDSGGFNGFSVVGVVLDVYEARYGDVIRDQDEPPPPGAR
ncbi:hypothetical protein DVA67_031220 [Solirubrobacter sp. CPCC 204708]|uniref:DUF4240 domain-containing protein n=1 Tax=Solirubrobacter deserti TaxID=2282478 RepID=A0ABT4RQ80_9ACTN|nr:hypothetical protein [Solirubrobacter deserti]MBE2320475.1 hypothetical protein [Solirubrobacter deserti]MDA0140722.1 DUF4240 domain-containing protein [Solirubrobacter deserti]